LKAYEDLGLSATYLGDVSTKEQFEDFLSESLPVKNINIWQSDSKRTQPSFQST
jgi:hypothetical protein